MHSFGLRWDRPSVGSAQSMQYPDIIAYTEKLLAYWKQDGAGVMYPDHKTPEEKALAKRAKAAKAQALRRAKAAMAKQTVVADITPLHSTCIGFKHREIRNPACLLAVRTSLNLCPCFLSV